VLGLECAYGFDGEQVVWVFGTFGGLVDHDRRRDEMTGGHLRHVKALTTGNPVNWCVDMRAHMLTDLEPVPRPSGPSLVVTANLVHLQAGRLLELLGELDDRGTLVERLGQVYDLDATVGERLDEGRDRVLGYHGSSYSFVAYLVVACSVGAERLFEPLGSNIRVDLGVDHERSIAPLEPALD
jgi:hypothetical protein